MTDSSKSIKPDDLRVRLVFDQGRTILHSKEDSSLDKEYRDLAPPTMHWLDSYCDGSLICDDAWSFLKEKAWAIHPEEYVVTDEDCEKFCKTCAHRVMKRLTEGDISCDKLGYEEITCKKE